MKLSVILNMQLSLWVLSSMRICQRTSLKKKKTSEAYADMTKTQGWNVTMKKKPRSDHKSAGEQSYIKGKSSKEKPTTPIRKAKAAPKLTADLPEQRKQARGRQKERINEKSFLLYTI